MANIFKGFYAIFCYFDMHANAREYLGQYVAIGFYIVYDKREIANPNPVPPCSKPAFSWICNGLDKGIQPET